MLGGRNIRVVFVQMRRPFWRDGAWHLGGRE